MYKIMAFFRRDFLVLLSYRFRIILNLGYLGIGIFFLFFMGRTFRGTFPEYLARYGNDYFAFALVGMSVSAFVSTGLYSLSEEIQNAQSQGTLESLLMTPTTPTLILFGSCLWSFIKSFVSCLIYIGVAILILGITLSLGRILLILATLGLTFCCFLSLGMISAAFIMVFKQGNPINMIFGTSSYFLGGLLFPVEVLPLTLRKISAFLPMTKAATAIREILLVAPSQADWRPPLMYLALFALVAGPIGIVSLKTAFSRAKRDGSLVQF
jgi:ABC-2 type transport system permease protein